MTYARWFCLPLLLTVAAAADSSAQPPPPLNSGYFAFPGSNPSPGSAISAGRALADRWLGDEPFDQPCLRDSSGIELSPLLARVSRQDLRAGNRDYDETAAFFDFAGGRIQAPAWGSVRLAVYASQPLLRLEENAFTTGELGGPVAPATFQTETHSRELRSGVALSWTMGPLTLGAAPELTYESDEFTTIEQSGSPSSGTRSLEMSGSGFGGQAGVVWAAPDEQWKSVRVGVGARYLPKMDLDATQRDELLAGTSETSFTVERESAWEGGVSMSVLVSPAFRAYGGAGGRAAYDWTGLDVTTGASSEWSVGGEFHDDRVPWAFRFGVGHETHEGSPEPTATRIAIGFGWKWDDLALDVAALRRNLDRPDVPTSYDDRVLATLRFRW